MENIGDFWQWILNKSTEIGFTSVRAMEAAADMSHGAIGKRINDNKLPTVEMAEGLCKALGISWFELWGRAGKFSPGQVDGENKLLFLFRQMDAGDQRRLLAIAEALQKAGIK